MVLEEEELTKESLLEAVRRLLTITARFMDAMRDLNQQKFNRYNHQSHRELRRR